MTPPQALPFEGRGTLYLMMKNGISRKIHLNILAFGIWMNVKWKTIATKLLWESFI